MGLSQYGSFTDLISFPPKPARDYELDRSQITLAEIIGVGQFGDVHIGTCRVVKKVGSSQGGLDRDSPKKACEGDGQLHVAVKTCKVDADLETAEKFLEEAYIMQKFEHPHIIKLIGICSKAPIWIVMEVARLGELRAYLRTHASRLKLETLILYSYQLSTALSYLESKKFVHRDIAARNVLVSTPTLVKVSAEGNISQLAY